MRILLDNCTPRPLKAFLDGHEVKTAMEMGWAAMMNGELLAAAEKEFDLLITCDRNLRYQQNLAARTIGLLILTVGRWPLLKSLVGITDHTSNPCPDPRREPRKGTRLPRSGAAAEQSEPRAHATAAAAGRGG